MAKNPTWKPDKSAGHDLSFSGLAHRTWIIRFVRKKYAAMNVEDILAGALDPFSDC